MPDYTPFLERIAKALELLAASENPFPAAPQASVAAVGAEPAPQVEAEPEPAAPPTSISFEDLTKLVLACARKDREATKAAMAEFGATRLGDVDPDKYMELAAKLGEVSA